MNGHNGNGNGATHAARSGGLRVPPQDLEAEAAVLGSMMLNRDAVGDVLPLIRRDEPESFYVPRHRALFGVLVDMYDRGCAIDLITLRDELHRLELLKEIGGLDYVVQLAESVPSHLMAEHYARIVRDKALLRQLIGAAGRISQEAYDQAEETARILDHAEALLFEVANQRISRQVTPIRDEVAQVLQQICQREGYHITGLATGFIELDDMLSGLQPGEMIIVAARPSMGKTALGLCMAEQVASAGRPCLLFSLEMSKQAIVQRLLCARARVDSHKVRRGMLSAVEVQTLRAAAGELAELPLYVDDTPAMSVLELRSKARRVKLRHDIAAVFVDYLQLMHSPAAAKESRQQEVSEISRGLKALARELNVPVVVLAQLNRNPEGRSDNRPRMSDLRESGAIEQDADVIMLIHREEYYKKDACPEDLKGIAEIIIDKQRNGPTGVVKLLFNQRLTRFDNLAVGVPDPGYVSQRVPDTVDQYYAQESRKGDQVLPGLADAADGPAPF